MNEQKEWEIIDDLRTDLATLRTELEAAREHVGQLEAQNGRLVRRIDGVREIWEDKYARLEHDFDLAGERCAALEAENHRLEILLEWHHMHLDAGKGE